ncbi:MAG: BASS family bile acid:Na+ symporter [Myxococcota bacterium]
MDTPLQILIGGFAVTVMLSVGLALPVREVAAVRERPMALLGGLVLNYVLVPLWIVLLVQLAPVDPAAATGLLLCAAAPGGPVGAFFTQRARGALGVAVALVVVMNLLNPVVTTAWIGVLGLRSADGGPGLDLLGIARTIVVYQLIPLGLGVVALHKWPEAAARVQPWVARAAQLLMGLMAVGFVLLKPEVLLEAGPWPVVVASVSVWGALGMGWAMGRGDAQLGSALALTAGIRNMSMVMVTVAAWFPDPATLLGAISYSVSMFVWSGLATLALKRP